MDALSDTGVTLGPESLARQTYQLIQQCEQWSQEQQEYREKALDAYHGEPSAVKYDENRSKAVSQDIRAAVKKILPSIMRTILANDKIVEYQAKRPDQEDMAQQATDYVNSVVVPEANVERALHAAIWDALVLKTGILKWVAYEKREVVYRKFSGQSPDILATIDGEISDEEYDEDGTISFTLKTSVDSVDIRLEAIPRGAFLISSTATSIEDSPYVGERQRLTRSTLISRGYDPEKVKSLAADERSADLDAEERKGEDFSDTRDDTMRPMQFVRIYDGFMRADMDGDGIAELHHIVLGQGKESGQTGMVVLEHEPASEINYADVFAEPEAHEFEGHSVAEDLVEIQNIKTVLLRQTMDNLSWQNNPQFGVDLGAIEDPDPIFKPMFGKPILLKPGRNIGEAIQPFSIPMVADKSFAMLSYLDEEAKNRTGISDASGGVAAESLQNMSATGAAMINEAGVAQAEMIVRNLARGGIRRAFRGLLGLVIAHADGPRTFRLRGEWKEVDPTTWDAGLDCVVNVGLGAGTRERDMMMLQMIYGMQKEVLMTMGPQNPLVSIDQLYNTMAKMAETAGFASADPYISRPDPEVVKQMMDAKASQPTPEMQKLQAQMQLEQMKMQANISKEQAQMQADLQVKRAEIDADMISQQKKLESDAMLNGQKLQVDLQKIQADHAAKMEALRLDQQRFELERMRFIQEKGQIVQDVQSHAIAQGGFAQASDIAGMVGQLGHGIMAAIDSLRASNEATVSALTAPKEVVRDETGRAVGVQTMVN